MFFPDNILSYFSTLEHLSDLLKKQKINKSRKYWSKQCNELTQNVSYMFSALCIGSIVLSIVFPTNNSKENDGNNIFIVGKLCYRKTTNTTASRQQFPLVFISSPAIARGYVPWGSWGGGRSGGIERQIALFDELLGTIRGLFNPVRASGLLIKHLISSHIPDRKRKSGIISYHFLVQVQGSVCYYISLHGIMYTSSFIVV